ncbi:hypothetical protein BV898_19943, partial [Hypsibius exemplaris]
MDNRILSDLLFGMRAPIEYTTAQFEPLGAGHAGVPGRPRCWGLYGAPPDRSRGAAMPPRLVRTSLTPREGANRRLGKTRGSSLPVGIRLAGVIRDLALPDGCGYHIPSSEQPVLIIANAAAYRARLRVAVRG